MEKNKRKMRGQIMRKMKTKRKKRRRRRRRRRILSMSRTST